MWMYYDLYVDSILRLAILCMLSTKIDDFACHFGLQCSSFCKMNIGTSVRSPSGSLGYELYRSVALANKLLERTSMGVISTLIHIPMSSLNVLVLTNAI